MNRASNSSQGVRGWREPFTIPTYTLPPPDRNPVFFEKRVYQGSSGKVYPLPVFDKLTREKKPKDWDAWHLENEYVRVMLLPEIGGRVHHAFDKTMQYDFFYRQDVIKPALVGLGGPWCSGGVEFNWPQHHRPSTFMPVDATLEEHPDGSRTVWMSEHDPMFHLKGMAGISLSPGSSVIEAKVRLYNRTPFTQSFLWWANVAARVHDQYQSFFPPDVRFVADHAVRAMSSFPVARNFYYGVDYRPGTDLTWYKNIPVPTSYMVMRTDYDFSGGFDHAAGAGFVHVANRHIAPGKKQWTWGNHAFGWAWDRELTDENGPYVELMGGAYTDNQPDFSYLMPYETKTFSQYWWPIQKIGTAQNASRDFALHLDLTGGTAHVGVAASRRFEVEVVLRAGERVVLHGRTAVAPGEPYLAEVVLEAGVSEPQLELFILREGKVALSYRPLPEEPVEVPPPATEPPLPEDAKSADELFLIGEHLEQYRHATRYPEAYWLEALRRDPGDSRCNAALGLQALKRGRFADAESYLRTAVARLRHRHPNPVDGEPLYYLGLALRFQEKLEEAYKWFYKSTWNYAWRGPGYYQLACLDGRRGEWPTALEHLDAALAVNTMHSKAAALRCAVLRKLGRAEEALENAERGLRSDLLDHYLRNERVEALEALGRMEEHGEEVARVRDLMRDEVQTYLDVAIDYAEAGLYDEALRLLSRMRSANSPMVEYARAWILERSGFATNAARVLAEAAAASPDYCFPDRVEEELMLREAMERNPSDARAPYYLGCYLYDKKRYDEAIAAWETARERDASFPTTHRNLGIAYYNVRHAAEDALASYQKAFELNPTDGRVLYELDQLRKKMRVAPAVRLARLEESAELIGTRDDLSIEYAALLNLTGRHERAKEVVSGRQFHPWEGGEGKVMGQHVATNLALGRQALADGNAAAALDAFELALSSPENLGEAKHLLAATADIEYHLGLACEALGRQEEARTWFSKAAEAQGDFSDMAVTAHSKMTYYKAMSLRKLGREAEGEEWLEALAQFARTKAATRAKIDYFATSLPDLLMFDDDLQLRNEVDATFLLGVALLGKGDGESACESLRKVLSLEPAHYDAQTFLRQAEAAEAGAGAATGDAPLRGATISDAFAGLRSPEAR